VGDVEGNNAKARHTLEDISRQLIMNRLDAQ
jgi:hypothetical protein